MKKYALARLNKTATFGHMDTTYDSAGGPHDSFKVDFTKPAGDYSMSLNQQLQATRDDQTVDRVLVVRHDDRLQSGQQLYCQVDGHIYRATSLTVDNGINAFDTVALSTKDNALDSTSKQ